MRRFAILAPVLAMLLATPSRDLARAQAFVDELRYQAAIKTLDRVLQDPDGTAKERIDAYRLLGIAYAATDAPEAAEAAFAALLEIEPGYVLDPLLSPKIRSAFDRAKKTRAPPVTIVEVVATAIEGRVEVSGRVDDAGDRVDTVEIHSRSAGDAYAPAPMARDGDRIAAAILLPISDRHRVEYYVVARDRAGREVARFGSAEAPSSIVIERPVEIPPPPPPPPITPEEETPWYGEWWVWTIVIGAVGIGVAATVIAVEMDGGAPPGTLDPIRLE